MMQIPKEINESICPRCFDKVLGFKWSRFYCQRCKGIWIEGSFRKTKLKLEEFLAKELKK